MDLDNISMSSNKSFLAEEADALNPNTFEDYFFDDNDNGLHWLTKDHLYKLQTARDKEMKVPPLLSSWKESKPTSSVQVTVAKARQLAWKQGIKEIDLHTKNASKLPGDGSITQQVYQFMFGTTSQLYQLFYAKLGLTKTEYITFLMTYLKSCQYKMSAPNLHNMDDDIKFLMPTTKYNKTWQKIATLDQMCMVNLFGRRLKGS